MLLLYTIYRGTQNESSLKKAQEKEREYTKRSRLEIEGKGITTRVFRDGKTYNIGDVREDPDYIEAYSAIRSELAVPIIVDTEVLGVLNVEDTNWTHLETRMLAWLKH